MISREELRHVVQSMVDSYETRVNTVNALIKQATEALQNSHREQQGAIAQLRDLLAKSESLRKKDFDSMMEGVLSQQRKQERKVAQVVEGFCSGAEETVAELRGALNSDGLSAERFTSLGRELLARQGQREREVAEALREFHYEQEELSTALGKLLAKGESATVKDLKSMVKALQVQRREREGELGIMLKELDRVSDEVRGEWQGVMTTMRG